MLKKNKKLTAGKQKLVVIAAPQSPASEQFRKLRTNINFSSLKKDVQSLVITSALASEGKSWIAANLAAMFAQEGKKVLLVDSDMRNPSAHETFNIQNELGLSNILAEQIKAESAVKRTSVDNLDLLVSGPIPYNPAELLASTSMDNFMESAKKNYDIIIFDSPPLLSVVDGQILANKCDGSILVINSGNTERQKAIKAKEAISLANGKLMGVILNNYLESAANYH